MKMKMRRKHYVVCFTLLIFMVTLLFYPFFQIKVSGPGVLTSLDERGSFSVKNDNISEVMIDSPFYAVSSSVHYVSTLADWLIVPLRFKTLDVEVERLEDTTIQQSTADREDRIEQSGIHYRDHVYQVVQKHTEDDIHFEDIEFKNFRGSSAGLMLTLHLIHQQSDAADFLQGRNIVGTGSVDAEGNVTGVGSVTEKVKAAQLYGAEVFLVPQGDNEMEAQQAATRFDVEFPIVGVGHITDALTYVEECFLQKPGV